MARILRIRWWLNRVHSLPIQDCRPTQCGHGGSDLYKQAESLSSVGWEYVLLISGLSPDHVTKAYVWWGLLYLIVLPGLRLYLLKVRTVGLRGSASGKYHRPCTTTTSS